MRVRITRNHKEYAKGQIVEVSPNVAFGLIDAGYAVVSKDIVETDTKTKGVSDGSSSSLRSHKRR